MLRVSNYILQNPKREYVVSVSGGKDSELTLDIFKQAITQSGLNIKYRITFFNTSNEVADVYKRIKQIPNIEIINPKIGWRQWITQVKNYAFPTIWRRTCCATYKEGAATEYLDTDADITQVLGVRATESTKRAEYEFLMDNKWSIEHYGANPRPPQWNIIAPIVELTTTDVWLLTLIKQLPINRRYKIGCTRVGCLICPYASTYDDIITRTHYPHQWRWFVETMTKAYDIWNCNLLGWTVEEWIGGAWRNPTCKNRNLLRNKPSDKNAQKYADLKGIPLETARRFFQAKCKNCGGGVPENDVAMSLKLLGRDADLLCCKCLCKHFNITKDEYIQKLTDFKNSDCKLF